MTDLDFFKGKEGQDKLVIANDIQSILGELLNIRKLKKEFKGDEDIQRLLSAREAERIDSAHKRCIEIFGLPPIEQVQAELATKVSTEQSLRDQITPLQAEMTKLDTEKKKLEKRKAELTIEAEAKAEAKAKASATEKPSE